MSDSKLNVLAAQGQSVWLDYINRSMIENGRLKTLIDQGLRGLTSNPSIFNQVISKSKDYDEKIIQLKESGKGAFEIYDELTVADIRDAADLFRPVYESTKKLDGYVSLEINPELANDTKKSIIEGKRLFKKVGRPNLMIKVPATDAGYDVVTALIASGINVNVTLIFSAQQYLKTVEAYQKGLESCSGDLAGVHSVASVFVSRADTVVDQFIERKATEVFDDAARHEIESLTGKAAVANCRVIYEMFKELFSSERFAALKKKGAPVQRVLWGSTSTKNPGYSDVKYVEELIAPSTVNTIPENTLNAFLDHGRTEIGITGNANEAEQILRKLYHFRINIDDVNRQLLEDGVSAFDKAFKDLIKAIEIKADQLCSRH